jgi:RNA 2',3'-cyclic 3'-phosphodiesterase
MIRAFLAIDLPDSYQAGMTAVQDYLKKSGADVRWVSVGNIHLTLKFFGDIAEDQVELIAAAASRITRTTPVFSLGVQGVGAFPGPKSPRVIWLGLTDQTDILGSLVQDLEQAFTPLGFPLENRKFTPHLTLGRVRSSQGRDQLCQFLQSVPLPDFTEFQVDHLILYRSTLRPQGALYTPLAKIGLGNS